MAEKKAWIGIKINHCQFQGVIVADPVANGDYTFLTLKTSYSYQDPNGQYVEIDQDIPLMVEPNGPVNVVETTSKKAESSWHGAITKLGRRKQEYNMRSS